MKAGDMYFVSGQVGVDPETKEAAADITAQTEQVMHNIEAVLSSQKLTMDNVVKTTIFVADMGDFADVNAVYEQYFTDPKPARATVAVKELPRVASKPILVEIEVVATTTKRSLDD